MRNGRVEPFSIISACRFFKSLNRGKSVNDQSLYIRNTCRAIVVSGKQRNVRYQLILKSSFVCVHRHRKPENKLLMQALSEGTLMSHR